MVDFSFIVSLYVSDLPNVTIMLRVLVLVQYTSILKVKGFISENTTNVFSSLPAVRLHELQERGIDSGFNPTKQNCFLFTTSEGLSSYCIAGISWLHGDTLALTLPGENRIAYANVGRASSRLALSYKSLIGDASSLKSPEA